MDIDQHLEALARRALDVRLTDELKLRMQEAVGQELRREWSMPPREVMTPAEVAAYLRVTPDVIEELLGDIPCFELGGKLLFRKDSVDAWTHQRERKLTYEILEFDARHELVL